MSTKKPGLRLLRTSPGGRQLRQEIVKLAKGAGGLQVTAIGESGLRGLRALFPFDEAEKHGIELIPLGNLVSRVCRLARVQTLRVAQAGQVVAAIAEACSRLPGDNPLAIGANMPGIHRAIAETLQVLRGHGLDPSSLDLVSESAEPYLREKLRGLSFVLRESDETLRLLGREHLTNWLTRSVSVDPEDCEDVGKVAIFLDDEVSPALADWIAWLAKTKAKVTLLGEAHSGIPSMFSAAPSHFPGIKVEGSVSPESLAERLFARTVEPTESIQLEIIAAADVLAESEWNLRRCAKEMDEGAPAESIAIVARELGTYAPSLHSASRRLDVPLTLASRVPLLSNRLIAFFLELLEALGDRDVRALIKPCRSVYAGLSVEVQAGIESVLREVSRGGDAAWNVLETLQASLAEQVPWLEPLLEWRSEAIKRPAELHDWYSRILTFAEIIPWQEAATKWPEFIERDARAQAAMQRSLTERASLSKVHRTSPEDFAGALRWIRSTWEGADYSVPGREDGIRVVQSAAELGVCNSVYVMGMLEGELPKRPREDPILGDLERDELSKLAKFPTPLPTSRDEALREREEFVRLCGAAGSRLTFSYRMATGERGNIPTAYLEEAKRAVKDHKSTNHSRVQLTPTDPFLEADILLLEAELGPRQALASVDFVDAHTRSQFAWEQDRAFEPKQLRRAVTCPFRFFARDRLGLRPTRRLQIWGRLIDLPIKAQLATQPNPLTAELALRQALDEFLDAYVGRLAPWELALVKSGAGRMIDDWIRREFRARELWPRGELRSEVPFGEGGLNNRAGGDIYLSGSAPAVGKMGEYSLIRLYEVSAPDRIDRKASEGDFLYYVLWAVLGRAGEDATALEIETLGHSRRLYVFPRLPGALPSDSELGLMATVISTDEDGGISVGARAKERLQFAVRRARTGEVKPTPSQSCVGCAYGELCRRSSEYGESDDPFEAANE